MAYDDQIMVATGDAEHPGVEEVTLENIPDHGGSFNPDVLPDSTNVSVDNDLIITREGTTWYKKAVSKIWDYIKTKLGISSSGSTSKYLNEKGQFTTPPQYSLPLAANGTRGGIQIGYTQSGKNYPVQLDSEKAYVNVPWSDTTYSVVSTSANGLAPKVTDTGKFLKGDGTWASPPNDNTTYTIATGDSNGQIKVTPSVGSAYNVNVKGLGSAAYTASSAYATSGHTHTASIAADSGTNQLSLAANTKYKLTAGGSTFVFTTPPDNNTDSTKLWSYQNTDDIASIDTFIDDNYLYAHGKGGGYTGGTKAPGSHNGFGVLSVHTHNGNYFTQLGFDTSQAALWLRNANNENSFGSWLPIGKFTAIPTDGQVVVTDGIRGGIKSSGYTIAKSVPSDAVFTDTKVTQTAVGTDYTNWRPLVFGSSNSGTEGFSPSTVTDVTYTTQSISCRPSTGTIRATTFKGNLDGNASEAKLQWGGQNFSGSFGPIDAAMVDPLGANRLFGIKASAITVEYSRDTGTTWTDYGATDAAKRALFVNGTSLLIGKADSTNKATANGTKYMLRVTIDTGTASVYTVLNKLIFYISTNGSNSCTVKIQKALQSTPTTFVDHTGDIPISGWSGYNVVNISGITTYGNSASSQYGRLRFIFKANGGNTSYNGLSVSRILGFGGVGWSVPSTMAGTGHLYSFDDTLNATFPTNLKMKSDKQVGYHTATPTSGQVVVTDGTEGGIKSSGYTIAKSVPSNAVFTDTDEKVKMTYQGGTYADRDKKYCIPFSTSEVWSSGSKTESLQNTNTLYYMPYGDELYSQNIRAMTLKIDNNGTDDDLTLNGKSSLLSLIYPVGTIIHSTTCDTEAKVKAAYGGTTWIQHTGYVLRGASSSVVANQASNDGGADSVTVSSVASHNHTQNSHGHNLVENSNTDQSLALGPNPGGAGNYLPSASSWSATNSNMGWKHIEYNTATNNSNGANYTVNTLPKYKNVYIWERTA